MELSSFNYYFQESNIIFWSERLWTRLGTLLPPPPGGFGSGANDLTTFLGGSHASFVKSEQRPIIENVLLAGRFVRRTCLANTFGGRVTNVTMDP